MARGGYGKILGVRGDAIQRFLNSLIGEPFAIRGELSGDRVI